MHLDDAVNASEPRCAAASEGLAGGGNGLSSP